MTEFKCVPVVPTYDMTIAGAAAGCASFHSNPQLFANDIYTAMLAAAPAHDGEVVMQWREGLPPKYLADESFIALLDDGEKVVLRALPEEYSYQYKTADDTYYKDYRVKKWMQFPDSEYKSYTAPPRVVDVETAKNAARYLFLKEHANGGFSQSGKPWAVLCAKLDIRGWQQVEAAIDAALKAALEKQ